MKKKHNAVIYLIANQRLRSFPTGGGITGRVDGDSAKPDDNNSQKINSHQKQRKHLATESHSVVTVEMATRPHRPFLLRHHLSPSKAAAMNVECGRNTAMMG